MRVPGARYVPGVPAGRRPGPGPLLAPVHDQAACNKSTRHAADIYCNANAAITRFGNRQSAAPARSGPLETAPIATDAAPQLIDVARSGRASQITNYAKKILCEYFDCSDDTQKHAAREKQIRPSYDLWSSAGRNADAENIWEIGYGEEIEKNVEGSANRHQYITTSVGDYFSFEQPPPGIAFAFAIAFATHP